ncbi:MAG: MFS transporter [Oscillospiraceae bacterium]|nr:MFS transporter [Oscillospiraceae bacterium]
MREKTSKFHYAWLILIAAVCIQGGIIGIMVNCTGVIFSAIIEDLGFRSGDLSIYYTIRAFLQAAACGITTKLFLNKNSKLIMTGLATLGLAGYVGMYFYTQLWQWYFSGVLVGICMSCVLVVIPVVLNNWFATKNGLVIGIAMAASGLAGAVFSPVLSSLITTMGWRKTAVFNGVVSFLLIVIPTLFLLVKTPEEKGMKPYGWDQVKKDNSTSLKTNVEKKSYNMPKVMFTFCAFAIIVAGIMTQFGNQLPMLAQSVGYTIQVGAMVTSFNMVGNVFGKLAIGVLADKIGIFPSVNLTSIVIAASTVMLLFSGTSPVMMYAGALLLGLVYSMGTTVPPLVFMEVYGPDEYKSQLSRFQSYNSVVMALASSGLPYIYDFTGSFNGALILGFIFAVVSMTGFNVVKKKADKIKAEA